MSALPGGGVPVGAFDLTSMQAGLASAGGVGGAGGGGGGDERRGGVDVGGSESEGVSESEESESSEEEEKREKAGKMIIFFTHPSNKSSMHLIRLILVSVNASMYSLCCLSYNFHPTTRHFHCYAIEYFQYGVELSLTVCTSWPKGPSSPSASFKRGQSSDDARGAGG